ncbi:T9SS type A sorting domain-containing protein [Labilibacter marinus]|uniref:T9SS type A sorting domain-containing protein n=1 Tax=Labilibacter marinus TaxID=1477105 RepID=UPI00094F7396|nr:T9SS type A sorting domain-containing protein [Labilibacter marinus]
MKKVLYFIPLLTLIGIGIFLSKKDNESQRRKTSQSLSSEEIIQQEINGKIERRKNGYAKSDKPDKYVEYYRSLITGVENTTYSNNYKMEQLKSAIAHKSSLKSATATLPWINRGPGNIGGRTRGIIVDPDDATKQTWFAGSVAGGIWKTTNAGDSWNIISPDLPNLATVCLAMAPSNSNVIYAGTGEGYYNLDAVRGDGIFKSTDKGENWTQLESTKGKSGFYYVNSLVVSHTNENVIWAATNSGIVKSADGGDTWYVDGAPLGNRYQKVVIHPTDESTLWVTSNDVGIYKTENGGENWFLVYDLDGVGRIELVVSPNDPEKLYAIDSNSQVYYSKDGGTEWAKATESGEATEFLGGQGWYNSTMAINPTNSNKGFIGGIDLYSFELGIEEAATDRQAFAIVNGMNALLGFDYFGGTHANGGVQFKSGYNNIYEEIEVQFGVGKSQKAHRLIHDGGSADFEKNFEKDLQLLDYTDLIDVPFVVQNKTSGEQLNASFIDENKNGKFDVTADSYEVIIINNVIYDGTEHVNISAANGNYSVMAGLYPRLVSGAIWDEATLPTAAINLSSYKLKNRRLTASKISNWQNSNSATYSHADHHNISIIDNEDGTFQVLVGNDGGIGYSSNGGSTWTSKSNGYVTSQFYGITRHPSKNIYFGGMQDNGSALSGENPEMLSDWTEVLGGDGFDVVWHPRETNKMIGCYYYNQLQKTEDGGLRWMNIGAGIGDNGDGGDAPFITRIASSISDPDLLFTGGRSGIWKSSDFGDSWKNINMGSHWGYYDGSSPKISISEANPNIVWAGVRMNDNQDYSTGRLHVSTNGGDSFVALDVIRDMGAVTNILTHPTDPETAYALFSFSNFPKIFRTTDLGQSWEDITGFGINGSDESSNGFPDVVVNTLQVMPYNTDIIWAGTEIGLFISYDNGTTWEYADNGIPAVSIWDIKIVGDEIILGTHGLGIWTVKVNGLSNELRNPYIQNAGINPQGDYVLSTLFEAALDSFELYADNSLVRTYYNIPVEERIDTIFAENGQLEKVSIFGYKDKVKYASNIVSLGFNQVKEPVSSYLTDFSDTDINLDFIGDDFIIKEGSFSNKAIHSPHPYPENKDLYYNLKTPVIISEDPALAFMKYYDIAFVEVGESGSAYPQEDFYDYVVVEGTKDGLNWKALSPGYDYDYKASWSVGGTIGRTPAETDFVDHHIELYDTFEANDTILIRFKLRSDQLTNGWGWVIDNLRIQGRISSVNDGLESGIKISIYPNPISNGATNLKITDPYIGSFSVFIYDTSGKQLMNRTYFKGSEQYEQQIDLSEIPQGLYLLKIRMNNSEISEKVRVK